LKLPQGKLIVHAGGINPERDLETVIRALAVVSNSIDVHFVVAGSGDPAYVESLKRLAETLGIQDRVVFVGKLFPEEARALMSLSEVGLVSLERNPLTELAWPSRIVEFVKLGKPLIVPNLRFLRLVLGDSAFFYEPGNRESLETALTACMSHAGEAEAVHQEPSQKGGKGLLSEAYRVGNGHASPTIDVRLRNGSNTLDVNPHYLRVTWPAITTGEE